LAGLINDFSKCAIDEARFDTLTARVDALTKSVEEIKSGTCGPCSPHHFTK
jgi:hypothetical protein